MNKDNLSTALIAGVSAAAVYLGYRFLFCSSVDYTRNNRNVVITGSSAGLGYALAHEFANLGDNVVIMSRSQQKVDNAVSTLNKDFENVNIIGRACDVTNAEELKNFGEWAQQELGSIDIWINNAGKTQSTRKPIWEVSDSNDIRSVIETNLLGAIYGTQVAINLMAKQPNGGNIFLMDGAGGPTSKYMSTPSFASYGASKAPYGQMIKTLNKELKKAGDKYSKIKLHICQPGMVATDLLLGATDLTPMKRKILNCLSEEAETVAKWLVPRIRKASYHASRSIIFLGAWGVVWRFASRYYSNRDIISKWEESKKKSQTAQQ